MQINWLLEIQDPQERTKHTYRPKKNWTQLFSPMHRTSLSASHVISVLVAVAASLQACHGPEGRAEPQASEQHDSVYQWSAEAPPADVNDASPRPTAFLWIPPSCERVRGVVIGQNNMLEQPVLEDSGFRATLANIGFAAVWITPMIGNTFGPDDQRRLDALLASLAAESGYAELATAPVVPIGHSALAEWPYRVAAARPDRTILAISLKGSWPDLKKTDAGWSGEQVAGVPLLFVSGEYEWADERAGKCLPFRKQFPAVPFSMLADAGGGHFDVHDPLVRFLGDSIQRAARARLPARDPPTATAASALPTLRRIDATKEGWLVDRWRQDRLPRHPAAPVADYAGDRGETFWCFDEEHARSTEALQGKYAGKKPQLAGYLQAGTLVEQDRNTHQQVTLQWLPDTEGDGLVFTLTGTFLDTVPEGRPERWTGRKAGSTIDHATGGGPVVIRPICGPVERRDPDTFAIAFDRLGFRHPQKSGEIWLLAEHPGDEAFKRCVQQSVMRIPVRNTNGPAQTITFPVIPDQLVGAEATIPLTATSSAGAAARVRYYVHSGPAVVADDGASLQLTALPPRARFPVKVNVVAWQWGRTIAPPLQSAEPVTRQFLIYENRAAMEQAARAAAATPAPTQKPFVHPGLLHDESDLERMRRHVAAKDSPWIEGFEVLKKHPASSATWKIRGPLVAARFDADDRGRSSVLTFDADAAYQNTLMWCVTGDKAHARKAAEILDAWASTLRLVDGHDARLRVALTGFKLISAAELLRHTFPEWDRESVARFEQFVRGVILPQIRDFATFANGNWDAACLLTVMAAGVFLDDHDLFDRAVEHFRVGDGNGRLTHYVVNTDGQCQESGRDQQHTQLGLGLLCEACETAWHQGVDLYAEADDRLLAGFEYTARYNLGDDVPFAPHVDTTGSYRHTTISAEGRGKLRPIYELPWRHYGGRRGLTAPWTRKAAEKNRPEGVGVPGDHAGFGTLLFTRD